MSETKQTLCCVECDSQIVQGRCPKCGIAPSMQDTYIREAPWERLFERETKNRKGNLVDFVQLEFREPAGMRLFVSNDISAQLHSWWFGSPEEAEELARALLAGAARMRRD